VTLNTAIYLHGQADVPEFFEFCQRALLAFDGQARKLDQVIWSDTEGYCDKTTRRRANQLGQGLPAILDLTYRTDAPLLTVEQSTEHDDWCNEDGDCDGSGHTPSHWAEVSLDTAYSYKDPHRGWRCGDLHAALIRLFGSYLDEHGVQFSWQNETTGEVHDGYNNLDELGPDAAAGAGWFDDVALPFLGRLELESGVPESWATQ
jgi:hypothetical protein